jgi:DNA mismatch repair protein MutS2
VILHPADAEQKLGFHLVRRRLEGLAMSGVGEERLAAVAPQTDRARVERLLVATEELQRALRADDPLPLSPIPDVRQALRRAQPKGAVLDPEELAEVAALLGTMRRAQGYFKSRRERYPEAARLALQIEAPEDVEQHINRVIDPRGQVRDDASPELARISRRIVQAQDQLRAALLSALREAIGQGFATEEQPTIRNGRAVIPVRVEAKRKVQGFVHDVSGTGQTVYIEPAAVLDLNNEVRELELERSREIRRILQEVTAHLRGRLTSVQGGLDLLARLDELHARARLSNELDALVPELNDEGRVRIVRGRNPALVLHFRREAAESGTAPRSVVPLDLELSDGQRTLVVTGPNAGGKSVAMKTTGLLCLMAACGLPVPVAPGTSLPLFEKMFVDIGDQQSIEQDLSTFTSHLANLRRMLAEADERSLVLIDEAGTGTDPAEGGALAQAALEALTASGARTVATTHHGTLKAFAHETEGVENASMQFDQSTLAPTYVFQSGIPGSSYAFEIAERVGLDEDVLARSRTLVGEGKTALEDLIATFEARTQALASQLETARTEARRAEQARKSFEGRDRSIKERRQEIEQQALAEAERIVAEANARVERTIREIKEAQAAAEQTREAREHLEHFRGQVERRQEKVMRRRPARQSEPATAGPIAVGDHVRIDGAGAVGEVLELDEREAVVALGPMRTRARLDRLTKVGGPQKQRPETRTPRAGTAMPALTAQRRIDVRGQRVEEVIPAVTRLIDDAVMAGLSEVEILHGKGTGALREAVREMLAARPDVVSFDDAAWDAGGHGVTVAMLG